MVDTRGRRSFLFKQAYRRNASSISTMICRISFTIGRTITCPDSGFIPCSIRSRLCCKNESFDAYLPLGSHLGPIKCPLVQPYKKGLLHSNSSELAVPEMRQNGQDMGWASQKLFACFLRAQKALSFHRALVVLRVRWLVVSLVVYVRRK